MATPATGSGLSGRAGTGTGFGASALAGYIARLNGVLGPEAEQRIVRAAGMATKKAALSAAEDRLGADRAMSNFRQGKVALSAGFDSGNWRLDINHRPAGVWILADQGRKRSGLIVPRVNGKKKRKPTAGRAVMTPQGPRAAARYGPSRGTGVFKVAAAREREQGTKAAWTALQGEFRRIVKG